jgi:hypothetical protein
MSDRSDLIVKHFEYLISEYNFQIARKECDPRPNWNAIVVFQSPKYGIEVVIDMDEVGMVIKGQLDTGEQSFLLDEIIKYYAPDMVAPYIAKPFKLNSNEFVESELVRRSGILRQHCEPLLRGEDWAKDKIKKIVDEKASRMARWYGWHGRK